MSYYEDTLRLSVPDGLSIFFISDVHLGAGDTTDRRREELLVSFLDSIANEAYAIFFTGDIFDFWFEYHKVVPRGFYCVLAKIDQLREKGIHIYFFEGNHDMWMGTAIEEISGNKIFGENIQVITGDLKILCGHGDGLGPGDRIYKQILKPVFRNRFFRWLFYIFHPDFSFRIAHGWSRKSRIRHKDPEKMKPLDQEWLYQYCLEVARHEKHDLYIFGHRHLVIDEDLPDGSKYLNTGEWIHEGIILKITGKNIEKIPVNKIKSGILQKN